MKKHFSSYWIRSAFYIILQRFSITVFGFINFILIIREFHADKTQMGIWALFLIAVGIFELVKTNLLKNAQIKFASSTQDRVEKSTIASASLLINIGVTFLFILTILLFTGPFYEWAQYKEVWKMLLWFTPGIVCMIFFSHFEAVQQSHLDFKGVFAGHFVRQAFFLCILVFHKMAGIPFDMTQLVIYQSISLCLGSIVLYIFTRKYLSNIFRPTLYWVKKIMGYGGFIFGSGTVAGLFQNLDQLMISRFGAHLVAPYNAAFRINALVDIPSYAASEVLFPKASIASVEEGPKKIKYLFERMVAILLSFTIPAAIFVMLFPSFIITIIAGPTYLEAAPILQLYMIAGILRPAQTQAANLLNSIGKARLCFYINVGYLLTNLLLNIICLHFFGFYGAAIGTVISAVLGGIFYYAVMRNQVGLELKNVFEHGKDAYKMVYTLLMNGLGRKQASSKMI